MPLSAGGCIKLFDIIFTQQLKLSLTKDHKKFHILYIHHFARLAVH